MSRFLFLATLFAVLAGGSTADAGDAAFPAEIAAREGLLSPARLEVPAGVRLRLSLRNDGNTPVEFESPDLHLEKVVAPNGAVTLTVPPLKAGVYTVIDEFHSATAKMLLIAK